MGRTRTFDEAQIVATCAEVFLRTGYEGTSIDDLVTATGLHRGSIYKAFGSKRSLFLAALEREHSLDLLLVALLELAPRDAEVRAACERVTRTLPDAAATLGQRLLDRASIERTAP